MSTSAARAALKLTTASFLAFAPRSDPKVLASGGSNSAGHVPDQAAGNAAAACYAADAPLRVPEEATLGEVLGADILPSAIPPTADPNYIENAIKRVAVFGWGGAFQLSRAETGLTGADPLVPRSMFSLDDDPLAAGRSELSHVYKTRAAADQALSCLPAKFGGRNAYYLGQAGLIFPTVVSDTTAPLLCVALRAVWAQHQASARAAAKTSEDLLWWYVGARLPIGTRAAPIAKEGVKDVGKAAATVAALSKIEQALATLVEGTQTIASARGRMVPAAALLSRMKNLTAVEKVKVMLKFIDLNGLAISKAGVVEKVDHFVMYAENEMSAFKFMKETGEVLHGRFVRAAGEYGDLVWSVLK